MANTIDIMGDEALTDALIDRSIVEFDDDTILSIPPSAFFGCESLTRISLNSVTKVGNSTFYKLSKLTEIELQSATFIGDSAFYNTGLINLNLPSVTAIGNAAGTGHVCYTCKSLKTVRLPSLTSLRGNQNFYGCTNLEKVYLNSYTYGGFSTDTFKQCNNLTDIYLPGAESAYSNAPWGATNATIHYNYDFSQDGGE